MRRAEYNQEARTIETNWSEWGFAAAVTGVLLTGGGIVVRWLLSFVDTMAKEQRSERAEWADMHRKERAEWRGDINRVAADHDERLDKVCETLTMAVHELGRIEKAEKDG